MVDASPDLIWRVIGPAARLPVALEVFIDQADAIEPLHVLHAVNARNDDARRETVIVPQQGAVHADHNHGVGIEGRGERNRVLIVIGGVEDEIDHPILDAGFREQIGEGNADPFGGADQIAVEFIRNAGKGRDLARRCPFEQDVVRQHDFCVHHPVDRERPAFRVDGWIREVLGDVIEVVGFRQQRGQLTFGFEIVVELEGIFGRAVRSDVTIGLGHLARLFHLRRFIRCFVRCFGRRRLVVSLVRPLRGNDVLDRDRFDGRGSASRVAEHNRGRG